MKNSWNNVAGSYAVSVCKDEETGQWTDDSGNDMPQSVIAELDAKGGEGGEIVINFLSSGYSDPGRRSGPPEDCYPPEWDDERLLDSAEFEGAKGANFTFSDTAGEALMAKYQSQIEDVELSPC